MGTYRIIEELQTLLINNQSKKLKIKIIGFYNFSEFWSALIQKNFRLQLIQLC
jgi:hypothetical protein